MSSGPGVTKPPRAAAPALEDIERLAESGWASIPETLRKNAEDVVIRVTDLADEDVLRDLEIENPLELMGLYQGVALTEKSLSDPEPRPDLVFLYRRAILDYWRESGGDLGHIVRHVLIHEIGHHFGFSDDDMRRLEEEADRAEKIL